MRDVYLVTSSGNRYILIIYRHGQRTEEQVAAEWQFVDYLAANSLSVAPAIRTKDGTYGLNFHAPEGIRYGVLSTFVEGEHLRRRSSVEAIHTYGRLVAQLHLLADQMPFTLTRPENDINVIMEQSIAAFESEVPERAEDLAYLRECQVILRTEVETHVQALPGFGFIHGDVIRANALVSETGVVTIIDFDLCGPGWRAYDIASYLHTIRNTPEGNQFEQAFLKGYSSVRHLGASEQQMFPVFEAVRAMFSIGIPAMNIYHWSSAFFYAFLDGSLNRLKTSMEQVVGG